MEQGIAPGIERAQALILAGEVSIAGERVTKAGTLVPSDALIETREHSKFVSRAGIKLAGALTQFLISVQGRTCADVGAATGGFSDALLQHGAERVYAVDVGYGDLHWKVRSNPRVTPIERTNARYLEALPEPVSLVAIDVSFISVTLILPAVQKWLTDAAEIIVLIKPQFEADRDEVASGGVIQDPSVHQRVIERVLDWCESHALSPRGLIASPIEGVHGNREFLLWLTNVPGPQFDRATAIAGCLGSR